MSRAERTETWVILFIVLILVLGILILVRSTLAEDPNAGKAAIDLRLSGGCYLSPSLFPRIVRISGPVNPASPR